MTIPTDQEMANTLHRLCGDNLYALVLHDKETKSFRIVSPFIDTATALRFIREVMATLVDVEDFELRYTAVERDPEP